MNPATIKDCIQACRTAYERDEPSYAAKITNFLAAWSTWEALRTRLIRVVIHHQGWMIKDADEALAVLRISGTKKAGDILSHFTAIHPSDWKGKSGSMWNTLLKIEPMRHKLTHGFKTIDPEKIKLATAIVITALEDQSWLETVELKPETSDSPINRIGPILKPRESRRTMANKPAEALFIRLGIQASKSKTRKSLTKNELEKTLLKLQQNAAKSKP